MALAGLAFWIGGRETPSDVVMAEALRPKTTDVLDAASAAPSGVILEKLWLGERAKEIIPRVLTRESANRPFFHHPQEVVQAREQALLLLPARDVHAIQASPLANPRRLADGRAWMQYDMRVLASRVEGDTFVLSVPGLSSFNAVIDAVEMVHGQYRWSGRLLDLSEPGGFSITQSMNDRYAVGSLKTPLGEYLLEAKDGLGWVVSSQKEFVFGAGHQDAVHVPSAAMDAPR